MTISCMVSPEKAANTWYINHCHKATHRLHLMQHQISFTLHWCSFPGLGREHVAMVFAPQGSQYLILSFLQPVATLITQDAKPKIVDTLLRLIFRVQQRQCLLLCEHWRLPICQWSTTATESMYTYTTYATKHCWPSINMNMQNRAVTVSLPLSPINAAILLIYITCTKFHFNYLTVRTIIQSRSVDAHLHDGLTKISCTV